MFISAKDTQPLTNVVPIKRNQFSSKISNSQCPVYETQFPLKTHRQLVHLEQNLANNQLFYAQFLKHFSSRSIFWSASASKLQLAHALGDYMFDYELMTNYTWTGSQRRRGRFVSNLAFKEFVAIQEAFREIVCMTYSDYSREENLVFFKDKRLPYSKKRFERKIKQR